MRRFYQRTLDYLGCDVMSNQAQILVTRPEDKICLVTLNRPEKRNALNGDVIQEWIDTLQKIANDSTIRVVILNGNGDHFCAGADIDWMHKMSKLSHQDNVNDAMQLATLLKLIYTFPKPVIGLVHGATMGGGLGVMACCDIVIAADNSVFCFSEAKIGLTPSVISPYVIPVMGERAARYYFLTAEKFDAKKAEQLYLVQHITPLDIIFNYGLSLADSMLKNSAHALSEAKKLIRHVADHSLSDDLVKFTAEHLATMRASTDAEEGLISFLEKRKPIWK